MYGEGITNYLWVQASSFYRFPVHSAFVKWENAQVLHLLHWLVLLPGRRNLGLIVWSCYIKLIATSYIYFWCSYLTFHSNLYKTSNLFVIDLSPICLEITRPTMGTCVQNWPYLIAHEFRNTRCFLVQFLTLKQEARRFFFFFFLPSLLSECKKQ